MIGYIEGKLLKKYEDRVLLLANQVGYEILLPAFVMETLNEKSMGEDISLFIFYQQTERQPKPVLIGFNLEIEKEFFQHFISVDNIGPLKAVKAMTLSVSEIASGIEAKDAGKLKQLKGIGLRTAQKIIASLQGKVDKFIIHPDGDAIKRPLTTTLTAQVLTVLVEQLGYKTLKARRMIIDALKRNKNITEPEDLLEEIYRGEKI